MKVGSHMGKKKMIRKRNGTKVVFDKLKVKNAVLKAFIEIDGEINTYAREKACDIANIVLNIVINNN